MPHRDAGTAGNGPGRYVRTGRAERLPVGFYEAQPKYQPANRTAVTLHAAIMPPRPWNPSVGATDIMLA